MKMGARVVLLLLAAASAAPAGEVWVVGSVRRSVKVLDTQSESVIATVPLFQGPQLPEARGITFSTVDGLVGAFAFIGQGSTLQVVDSDAKTLIRSVDLEASLSVRMTIVDLESSPNRAFGGTVGPEVRAYLVVVGNAARDMGSLPEPFWAVLDQRALVESPPSVPLVAASGFLHDSTVPNSDRGQAAGVSVMGSPFGASFLRAWVSTRVPGAAETMRATLLAKGPSIDAPWRAGPSTDRVLPLGRSAPEGFSVAVPQDGEAQVFPAGATGTLVDLGHGGSCELPPANLGPVAVRGPGAGGYEIVVIDLDAEELLRVNESTCAFQRRPLGSGPIDVTVDALFEHGSAWVANRDSDSVTVVRLDGTTAEIPLGPPPAGSCLECPVSIEARLGAGRGCTTSLRLSKTLTGAALAWDAVGCTDATFSVFCQCDRRLDLDCTCACDPLETPGCFGSLPIAGQTGVEFGLAGLDGALTRQLPGLGPNPGPMPYPPEPVIQLGVNASQGHGNDGGGGGTWIGTKPP